MENRLRTGQIECMICYDTVGRSAAVWSCHSCYAVFHLHCTRKWAKAPSSGAAPDLAAANAGGGAGGSAGGGAGMGGAAGGVGGGGGGGTAAGAAGGSGSEGWRCPGCQAVQLTPPSHLRYLCFCGQREDPPFDPYLVPHSCGETCHRPLGLPGSSCPHLCTLMCHPGPCPPCSAMGSTESCFCGGQRFQRRCSEAATKPGGVSCGERCGAVLRCGRHVCERVCHEGPCGECGEVVVAQCVCGKEEQQRRCSSLTPSDPPLISPTPTPVADAPLLPPLTSPSKATKVDSGTTTSSSSSPLCDESKGDSSTTTPSSNSGSSGVYLVKGAFSCSTICNKLLPCGNHHCQKRCHSVSSPCGDCQFSPSTVHTCPCGKQPITALLQKAGQAKGRTSCLDPIPTCGAGCGKLLPCGLHVCASLCHVGECPPCERPVEQQCACGESVRTVPCHKTLILAGKGFGADFPGSGSVGGSAAGAVGGAAGVAAGEACSGDAREGMEGAESAAVAAAGTGAGAGVDSEAFRCNRKCNAKKNCGRHRCNTSCCPKNPKNKAHSANTDAASPAAAGASPPPDTDPHLCMLVCGKKLRCGKHSCMELCHSGHCPPCLEASFSEVSCSCGSSFIPPPVPCGTPAPSCSQPCSKARECGHDPDHPCHFGDCPPCSTAVSKECVGGHVVLRGVPCGSRDIRCSNVCGKRRQCGVHACLKLCHVGPCDEPPASPAAAAAAAGSAGGSADAASAAASADGDNQQPVKGPVSCGQPCGAPRRECQHTCTSTCHIGSPCPDVRCTTPATITCACGRLSARVPCGAGGKDSDWLTGNLILPGLPTALVQPAEASSAAGGRAARKFPPGQCKLACNEECEKVQRKKVLAEAFHPLAAAEGGISNSSSNSAWDSRDGTSSNSSSSAVSSGELSQSVMDVIRTDPRWAADVESRLQYLVLGPAVKSSHASTAGWPREGVRVHIFKPMSRDKREAVHQMAGRWRLETVSKGAEPHRFTLVYTLSKSRAPTRKLPLPSRIPAAAGAGGSATASVSCSLGSSSIIGNSLLPLGPGFSPSLTAPAPPFDPEIDLNPARVVALLSLPRDSNVATQLVRFGGECELVWIDDRNAVAVFEDPGRAATAMRFLDHAKPFWGAVARGSLNLQQQQHGSGGPGSWAVAGAGVAGVAGVSGGGGTGGAGSAGWGGRGSAGPAGAGSGRGWGTGDVGVGGGGRGGGATGGGAGGCGNGTGSSDVGGASGDVNKLTGAAPATTATTATTAAPGPTPGVTAGSAVVTTAVAGAGAGAGAAAADGEGTGEGDVVNDDMEDWEKMLD
ncbi:hypothetical protein CLOM_g16455 [Closterium sp. NIES-68]|nr:hypothetical protein CLOM_g16455 [Closterium sp. NIES-68]GJP58220.1 hypothetical protein CLOP_g22689 [Closterium sp. NIES-67]